MSVEDRWQDVREKVRSCCPRCGDDPVSRMAAQANTPHTCHPALAAVRDYGLAVHERACRLCGALLADKRGGYEGWKVCKERARLAAMGKE